MVPAGNKAKRLGSRITEANTFVKDFKVPPAMGKGTLYSNWKRH